MYIYIYMHPSISLYHFCRYLAVTDEAGYR